MGGRRASESDPTTTRHGLHPANPSVSPEEEAVTFKDLLASGSEKKPSSRGKKHSEILTATPMKDVLVQKEEKKRANAAKKSQKVLVPQKRADIKKGNVLGRVRH